MVGESMGVKVLSGLGMKYSDLNHFGISTFGMTVWPGSMSWYSLGLDNLWWRFLGSLVVGVN
jgi:hypothetical protein